MSADPSKATLDELVREIGPLPGPLAAGYARQAAAALRALHEQGRCHGAVGPAALIVRPVTTKVGADGTARRRPTPASAVHLAEVDPTPAGATPADDLLDLGRALYALLAGRPPGRPPAPLATVRPDLPAGFAALAHRLLAGELPTAADIEAELAEYAPAAAADPGAEWAADPTAPRPRLARRPRTAGEKARIGLLVGLGLVLNLAAVGLVVAWLGGYLDRPPEPTPEPRAKKADRPAKPKKAADPDPDEKLD